MRLHRLAGPVLLGALLLSACTSSDGATPEPSTTSPTPAATTTTRPADTATATDEAITVTDSLGNEVSFDAPPERIVSMSPTATEMLFAIGAGDQVAATDSLSTYPEDAPTTDLSAFEPNIEAVATYDPDLVILADNPATVIAEFSAAEIPAIMLNTPEDLDGAWAQFELLGTITGHEEEAAQVVTDLRDEIAGIVDAAAAPDGTTYYHELDPTYYTVTSDTFIGEIYGLFGLTSIGDEADGAGTGFPQLSAEYILEADPDIVFLADVQCCAESAETVAARPGWDQLTAVQQGHVHELDADVVSRWGPRVVQFVAAVRDAVTGLEG